MFFDDIFIPAHSLQKPSRFDDREQLFVWQYDTGESTHDLFIDIGEEIRYLKRSFSNKNFSLEILNRNNLDQI